MHIYRRLNARKFITKLVSIAFAGTLITGCAANMAMNGQNGPDMEVVAKETSRQDVERHLGSPVSLRPLSDGGYLLTYDVEAKTDPSLTRAAGHGALDLFTFGLWEVVGGPLEAYQGRRVEVTVEYDKDDQFVKLESKQKDVF